MNTEAIESNNLFIAILKKAKESNWCTKYFCTTCGALEYRQELVIQGGENRRELIESLKSLDPSELMKIDGWVSALQIAFFDLPHDVRSEILHTWWKFPDECIRFFDVILFHFVRFHVLKR